MGAIGIIDNRKQRKQHDCDMCSESTKDKALVAVSKSGKFDDTVYLCRATVTRIVFELAEYNGQHKGETMRSDPRKTVKPMDIRHKRGQEHGP